MYTNQQRLSYAHLMKDVNSEQVERQGIQDWTPLSSNSHSTSLAQDIQIYQNQDEYVFAIQDMDLIEDFEWEDLQQLDSLHDAKLMAFVQAGEFPSEFVESIEFVYQAIHELNIDPANITFVGAGIGGAHAQMLAHTFGGNLFTHDAPPVAKMLDGDALLPGATYQTTLARMALTPQGPNVAENVVEKWSPVSEGSNIFKHEDYIGTVKEIDSVSNVLPVISWGSKEIASLLDERSNKKNKSSMTEPSSKNNSPLASFKPTSIKGGNAYVKLAEVGLKGVSYGTAIYDAVREGGSHDLDVFVNYLTDVSMSQEHIEELVMQTYQMYGMPLDESTEFELAQLASDMFEQQESLTFLSYNQMVDTIDYKLSDIMIAHGVDQTLLQQRPVHDLVNRLEAPINYALSKLDALSDQSSIIAYLEQRILGSEIKPDFESYAVVKTLDDFLRRELGSDVDELNQGLVDAANTVDFYIDEMAELADQTMDEVGDTIMNGIAGFSDLVGQVYDRFEGYLVSQTSQLQDNLQVNVQAVAQVIENLGPALYQQSDAIYKIDELLEQWFQHSDEQVVEFPVMHQLYQVVSDYLNAWPELKAKLLEPMGASPDVINLAQQLDRLSESVTSTQMLLNETAQKIEASGSPAITTSDNVSVMNAMLDLSSKLSETSDDILTLQSSLSETMRAAQKTDQSTKNSVSQLAENNRPTQSQEFRP